MTQGHRRNYTTLTDAILIGSSRFIAAERICTIAKREQTRKKVPNPAR